jgi:hypothetical protein
VTIAADCFDGAHAGANGKGSFDNQTKGSSDATHAAVQPDSASSPHDALVG